MVYTKGLRDRGRVESGTGMSSANCCLPLLTTFEEAPMTTAPRMGNAQSQKLPKDMVELATAIAAMPAEHRARLEPIYQRVVDSTRRRQRILALVQEALSQLRLDMKYLLFDLEATRRERNDYKQSLERGEDDLES